MADWKETSYGTPKSWDEIRSEQSNEEMGKRLSEKKGASPKTMLIGSAIAATAAIACLIVVLGMIFAR